MDIEDLIEPSFMIPGDFSRNDTIEINSFDFPKPLRYIEDQVSMRGYVRDLAEALDAPDALPLALCKVPCSKKYHIMPNHANLTYTYRCMIRDGDMERNIAFELAIRGKAFRANSGVMVITVVASPHPNGQSFSCQYDCHYCPKEPGHKGNDFQEQPRSYIFNEPGVRRANRNGFDAVLQLRDRARSYLVNGLTVDKIEIIILGGTWHSYPKEYREDFIRDLFYAANTLQEDDFNTDPRERLGILEEHALNEHSESRIIGVTIETRPDQITPEVIVELRRHGVTRVQIGVQHTDEEILKLINRRCTTPTVISAIRMLKDNCFKVDMHLMPDLPGSNVEKDLAMFKRVLWTEDLQTDQWKIYPCMTIPWTKISQWYDAGTYSPYTESIVEREIEGVVKKVNPLFELIMEVKNQVHPWIRLNRVIRDIPDVYMINEDKIEGIGGFANMRQYIQNSMKQRGMACKCIRCREVGSRDTDLSLAKLVVREYRASGGTEYFLSFEGVEGKETIMYGFLRLRLSPINGRVLKKGRKGREGQTNVVFPELVGSGLVRELHVYGDLVAVNADRKENVQHYGFGSRLMAAAEYIAKDNGYEQISVIAGVGVREYYRKRGYEDGQYFLTKSLRSPLPKLLDPLNIEKVSYSQSEPSTETPSWNRFTAVLVLILSVLLYIVWIGMNPSS